MNENEYTFCKKCHILINHGDDVNASDPRAYWSDIVVDSETDWPTGEKLCGECNGSVVVVNGVVVDEPESTLAEREARRESAMEFARHLKENEEVTVGNERLLSQLS